MRPMTTIQRKILVFMVTAPQKSLNSSTPRTMDISKFHNVSLLEKKNSAKIELEGLVLRTKISPGPSLATVMELRWV